MLDFIINPASGGGKGAEAAKKISAILDKKGIKYTIHLTTREKEATELAKSLSDIGAQTIIAVGGDGTIHETLNGIDAEKVNFGIIPCGTGNDFVTSAGIPCDVEKSLDVILNGEPKATDYMVCGGVKGLNVIGTGIDVDVLKRCKKSKILRGKLQYVISLIISLIKFKFYKFRIVKSDGSEEEREALIAAVGNGKRFGGGIPMCPEAEIGDGKLDFVIAGKLKKHKIPAAFMQLMKGNILKQDFTYYEKVEAVKIVFDKPVTVQVDGELYDGLDFDLSIVKGGLKLFRP
ncbi:MAG: diacylglycerol kinase family lipid kinase [Clostridia bacterium]|nr:diacylglycerol kinase family lipid kinase [Clostridia bacterium]